MHMTGLLCYTCGKSHPANPGLFVCPTCGGNLGVSYDMAALREESDLHRLLTAGRRDLFRYAHLLPIRSLESISPLVVGQTPLYQARRLGAAIGMDNVYLKDDSRMPSNSFKDRAGAVALAVAREQGASVIAAASTGNAGCSMACLCASVDLPCVVVVPESAPAPKLAQLAAYGAHVLAVRGTYDDACRVCRELCDETGWFNRMTGFNPYTREGKKTVSFELWEQFNEATPDRVVVSVGDGNIISGVWKGFCELYALGLIRSLPRIDCIQAEGSAAITHAIHALRATGDQIPDRWDALQVPAVRASTLADSISVDQPLDAIAAIRAVVESGGEAITVSDDAIAAAMPELARLSGVFAEPAAAAVWAGLRSMAADHRVDPEEVTVLLVTGSGLKDPRALNRFAVAAEVIDPVLTDALQAVSRMALPGT
ncbi:MAG: threonine synthase [Verrucomicrobia bacterium]|nr:threonine synthase [Kiritimatiellia bacterium]MCP5488085.1 threonine synthase [Verrucomicrobiota bacterium]